MLVEGAELSDLEALAMKMRAAGVEITSEGHNIRVRRNGVLRGVNVTTAPHPGFPTDMQAQFLALMSMAKGESVITETIFENRFMHVPELQRMGASVALRGNTAVVQGVGRLYGAAVMATDLRASASLVIAGIVADDETEVRRIYHLDRGYERIEEKLHGLGVDVQRVKGAEGVTDAVRPLTIRAAERPHHQAGRRALCPGGSHPRRRYGGRPDALARRGARGRQPRARSPGALW